MQVLAGSNVKPFQRYRIRVMAPDDMAEVARPQAGDLLQLDSTLRKAPPGAGLVASALAQHPTTTSDAQDPLALHKAVASVLGKNVGALGVAGGSWQLSSLAATATEQDVVKTLLANNVSPARAPEFARDILNLLNNPAVRTLLVGVSAGALTYTVVEKTGWSTAAKWWTVVLVSAAAAGLFVLLRELGIAA